jgi:hypothetical protein
MKENKCYVTMTDKFLSGWGMAQGKINKLIITCDNFTEASIVENNALRRSDMKYINVRDSKPYYNSNNYFVSWHDKSDYSRWFIPNVNWKG